MPLKLRPTGLSSGSTRTGQTTPFTGPVGCRGNAAADGTAGRSCEHASAFLRKSSASLAQPEFDRRVGTQL
jgi:hypothetical protein